MRRKILITLLALGTVGGYGAGFASLACHASSARHRRADFERHVAQVCVDAARRADPPPRRRPRPEPRPAPADDGDDD
jgi:hypothetical protein